MEDEVVVKDSFHIPSRGHFSFFGVFDGHGGRAAAVFTRDHLFPLLLAELTAGTEPALALTRAYLKTDEMFIGVCRGAEEKQQAASAAAAAAAPMILPASVPHRRQQSASLAVKIPVASLPPAGQHASAARSSSAISADDSAPPAEKDTSGTTAVSILIHHESYSLYVANVGDSRAVLSGVGGTVSLTNDHKADRPDEVDRIRRAGGFVVHKRVMGELAISRAIGDLDFKETGFLFVLPDPELCTHQLQPGDDFLLLACDGIYDVMSNEQACAFIRDSLQAGNSIQATSENLVRHAIESLNTRDNVTVIIVKLPAAAELTAAGIVPKASSAAQQAHAQLTDSHIMTPAPVATPHASTPAPQTLFPSTPIPLASPVASTPSAASPLNRDATLPLPSLVLPAAHAPAAAAQRHVLSPHHSSDELDDDNGIQFHDEAPESPASELDDQGNSPMSHAVEVKDDSDNQRRGAKGDEKAQMHDQAAHMH